MLPPAPMMLTARSDDLTTPVEPFFLLELSGQAGLDQVAEVVVDQRAELVLETAREHPLDLFLAGLVLKPAVIEQLLGPCAGGRRRGYRCWRGR